MFYQIKFLVNRNLYRWSSSRAMGLFPNAMMGLTLVSTFATMCLCRLATRDIGNIFHKLPNVFLYSSFSELRVHHVQLPLEERANPVVRLQWQSSQVKKQKHNVSSIL